MNRIFYVAKALVLGLLTTQIVSTLHVYLSNADLYRSVTTITEAGYLSVPNQRVMHTLTEFMPAFFGGLFFTSSIGAGLSVLSVALAWTWDRISRRNNIVLVAILLLWLSACLAANSEGFCPMVSLYFFVVPALVFISTLKWMPRQRGKAVWLNAAVCILPVAALMIIWTAHADQSLFSHIRDHVLLSNTIGIKINNFYYKYTLYPAEVFKSLNQKTLNACRVAPIKDNDLARRINNTLIRYDYLPVAAHAPVEIEIRDAEDILIFRHKGGIVLQTTTKDFLARPKQVLRDLAMQTDTHAFFRQATIFCLVLGFPVTLYVMVFALIRFVLSFCVRKTPSAVIAAALCFSTGLALLIPLYVARTRMVDPADLSQGLMSECRKERVGALGSVVRQRVEIASLHACRTMLASPYIPERCLLAKAFGVSRHPETYECLLTLLDDPCPNVVYTAFSALGQRGDKRAEKEILKRIKTSDHWYSQWYAYKALRRLGWYNVL